MKIKNDLGGMLFFRSEYPFLGMLYPGLHAARRNKRAKKSCGGSVSYSSIDKGKMMYVLTYMLPSI